MRMSMVRCKKEVSGTVVALSLQYGFKTTVFDTVKGLQSCLCAGQCVPAIMGNQKNRIEKKFNDTC
jgi:hypothetical protein